MKDIALVYIYIYPNNSIWPSSGISLIIRIFYIYCNFERTVSSNVNILIIFFYMDNYYHNIVHVF